MRKSSPIISGADHPMATSFPSQRIAAHDAEDCVGVICGNPAMVAINGLTGA
jgi:hypothetical protein